MESTKIEQNLFELRITEMDAQRKMIELFGFFEKHKIWKELGYKSLTDYCRRALDYDSNKIREIQRELGLVLLSKNLISEDPLVQGRIDKLKHWRRVKAATEEVPSYRILTNRSLLEIAKHCPKSKEDLVKISGIGERKTASFGDELIRTLLN